MTRRLGSFGNVSLPGTFTAGAIMTGVSAIALVPALTEWANQAADAGTEAVDDALYGLSLSPLRLMSARASMQDSHLTQLFLILQPRGDEPVSLADARVEVLSPYEADPLPPGVLDASMLRDADGSVARMEANKGDLVRFAVDVDDLSHPLRAGDAFQVWILNGEAKPLKLDVRVPYDAYLPVVDLDWSEVL
jgi:hypothetical protein